MSVPSRSIHVSKGHYLRAMYPILDATQVMPEHTDCDMNIPQDLSQEAHASTLTPLVLNSVTSIAIPNGGTPSVENAGKLKCYFLDRLPRELRDEIYTHLLVNPVLGQPESVEYDPDNEEQPNHQFGLSPNIILACKTINAEASEVLYNRNKFFMCCTLGEGFGQLLSPVLRNCTEDGWKKGVDTELQSRALGLWKVRKWRVLISRQSHHIFDTYEKGGVRDFCDVLHTSSPTSIHIAVIPAGMNIGARFPRVNTMPCIQAALNPFRVLRGVENLSIRDATVADIPKQIAIHEIGPYRSILHDERDFIQNLSFLAKGNTPLDSLFRMNSHLINYAQSFEPSEACKSGPEYLRSRITLPIWLHRAGRFPPLPGYPVNQSLLKAKGTLMNYDVTSFKQYRSDVISYLEPRYLHILKTSRDLISFIKEEKISGGLLSQSREKGSFYNSGHDQLFPVRGLVLLEAYASALLNMNIPRDTRPNVQRDEYFRASYKNARIVIGMEKLETASADRDVERVIDCFRQITSTLDEQYLEIRRARKELFDWDGVKQFDCKIDIENPATLEDGPIDWSCNEPANFGPKNIVPWAGHDGRESETGIHQYDLKLLNGLIGGLEG